MLVRDFYSSTQPIEINSQSTALALVTTSPLFALIDKNHFTELLEVIQNSSQYPTLLAEVEKSIQEKKDIFDINNTALLLALSNLMEDICDQKTNNGTQTRATISNWEQLNINDPYPFLVEIRDKIISITNTALSPAYKGNVSHPILGIQQLDIPTRGGYGGWELLQQSLYGWSSGAWGNLGNGDPIAFTFTEEGEYKFSFIRNEFDFYKNLVSDLFQEFGIPKLQETAINTLIDDIAGQIQVEGMFVVQPNQDPVDYIKGIGEYTIKILKSDPFKNSQKGIDFYKKYPNANSHLEKAGKIFKYWSIIRGSSNALLRIAWKMKAPEKVNFCLCLYDNRVTSCTEVKLVKKENTDNQEGYAGQRLLEPIEVLVMSKSEDGTLVETEYQKVKFEVVSGGGSISEKIVGTDGDHFVGTSWTLGDSGLQQVKAVAIDMITGQEVSEPVYFTATLKEAADITVRLDWAKLSGNTDIDLHVVDPFGEEIAFYHMQSASGGWLDRDDVIGPGPEHIYWQNAPAGVYTVKVHYYGSESQAVTTYRVTINFNEETYGPYTGSIAYHQEITIGTITVADSSPTRSATKFNFVEKVEVQNNKVYQKKK